MTEEQTSGQTMDRNAEQRILDAAMQEFAAKGFYGARTQAIAAAAGVNKALLHYYFRSKEKLYLQVLRTVFLRIQENVVPAWLTEGSMAERVERVVDVYMDTIASNPGVVKIILREVVDGGQRLRKAFREYDGEEAARFSMPAKIIASLGSELGIGRQAGIHMFVNLLGMCVISFISPVVLDAVARIDTSDFHSYLQHRRTAIKAMLLPYLRGSSAGQSESDHET